MDFNNIQDFKANFAHIYHKEVVPRLKKFENTKFMTKLVIGLLNTAVLCGAAIFIYATRGDQNPQDLTITAIIVSIIAIALCVCFYMMGQKNFELKVKNEVMPLLMKAFGNFMWIDSGVVDKYTIQETRLFERFTHKSDDDNFMGTYKGLKVNIDETELYYYTTDSKGRKHKHVVFDGIIVEVDIKKPFSGHTIVRKRGLINLPAYEEVKLEDIEFMKKYYVDANDQIEARYLFTTRFMERFKAIKNAFKANSIEASFQNNKMILALHSSKDFFVLGKLNRPVNDTKQFTELLNEFIAILEIIDELKLNENIGL